MGNLVAGCPCRKRRIGSMKEITLLLIGLDNAGKTCMTKHLLEEPTADTVPTVGFSSVRVKHPKYNVCIYDVGGGPKIRGIWKNYYALVHGIIFVVDASHPERFEECKKEIHTVITDHRISGKPILLFFNKQDIGCAVNEMELVNQLNLETLVNTHQCPTRVEGTCALYDEQKIKDPGVHEGFKWLIGHIAKDHSTLSSRVAREKAEQMKMEEKERLERFERVRRIREAREAEKQKVDSEKNFCVEHDDDDDVVEGNPFRPIGDIKKELDSQKKCKDEDILPDIPGIRVVHVSPNKIPEQHQEVILSPPQLASYTRVEKFKACNSSSQEDENKEEEQSNSQKEVELLSSSKFSKSLKDLSKSKKPKKRFKNRIVPQMHQPNSLANTPSTNDLPPLLPVANGHISSTKQLHELHNGQINWALAEELPPSAIYTVPRRASFDL